MIIQIVILFSGTTPTTTPYTSTTSGTTTPHTSTTPGISQTITLHTV